LLLLLKTKKSMPGWSAPLIFPPLQAQTLRPGGPLPKQDSFSLLELAVLRVVVVEDEEAASQIQPALLPPWLLRDPPRRPDRIRPRSRRAATNGDEAADPPRVSSPEDHHYW
jgi:hypothetical protein